MNKKLLLVFEKIENYKTERLEHIIRMANERLPKILKSSQTNWEKTTRTYNEDTAGLSLKWNQKRPTSSLTP